MNSLAGNRALGGQKEIAFKSWEEALELSRKANGPAHPATLRVLNSLGSGEGGSSREEGIKMLEETLALSRKANGNEHTFTLEVLPLSIRPFAAFLRGAFRMNND